MTDYHRRIYSDRASPNICPNLLTTLRHYLRLQGIKPDDNIIQRILFRRGISDRLEMQNSYGDGMMDKFRAEYDTV